MDPKNTKPLPVGSSIPSVTLTTADGIPFDLNQAIKQKPTVLIFYRGGWCVYCNKHLGQLKNVETPLTKLGYQIIAVSPDRVEKIRESLKKHEMNYMLLSDSKATAINAFGLAFKVDDETVKRYKEKYGIDLEADSGETHHLLPVPAAYVIDEKGIVKFMYADPNYKVRIDPDTLLQAAKQSLNRNDKGELSMSLTLKSSAFEPEKTIPKPYTCDGEDKLPALRWENAPAGTKSFALIMDDPDAPPGTWVHWVIYDIPDETTELSEGLAKDETLPNGAKQGLVWGVGDFSRVGYFGPCPPPGKPHRYYFKLYALDKVLGLPPKATKPDLLKAMEGHILEETTLMGLYGR